MQLTFDANQYEPSTGFDAWPDGWVPVVITNIEPKETKGQNGATGGMLGITIQAIDGPLKGKSAYFGCNLWNPNPQTVEIANKFMSALVRVTIGVNQGRLQFNSPDEMKNIPFYILAQRQKDNPDRNNFNVVRDIRGNDAKGQPPSSALVMAGTSLGMPTGAAPPPPGFGPPAGGPPPPPQFAAPGAPPAQAPGGWAPPGAPAPLAPAPGAPPAGWVPPGQPAAPPAYAAPPAQPPAYAAPPAAPGGWAPPATPGAPPAAPGGWAPPGAPPAQAAPPAGPPQQWAPPPTGAPVPAWGPR